MRNNIFDFLVLFYSTQLSATDRDELYVFGLISKWSEKCESGRWVDGFGISQYVCVRCAAKLIFVSARMADYHRLSLGSTHFYDTCDNAHRAAWIA